MVKILKSILITLVVVLVSSAFLGQASAEAMAIPVRGEGVGEISGYTITNLHYRLAEDPSMVSGVDFDLDGPASEVLISFDSPLKVGFRCSNPDGYHWVCELDAVKTGEVTKINISASE